jgi:hypothetical protein
VIEEDAAFGEHSLVREELRAAYLDGEWFHGPLARYQLQSFEFARGAQ